VTEPTVRSLADARLAATLGKEGCPICRYVADAEAAWLESILAESVNDVAFRRELDAARGFCRRHSRELLDADRRRYGGGLASAILFAAVLGVRGPEAADVARSSGRRRRSRLAGARRPPDCPACAQEATATRDALRIVVRLTADDGWATRIAGADICFDHLLALMSHPDLPAAWPRVEAAHLARIDGLRERLLAFAHDSSHDRRHAISDANRASVDAAAELLGGSREDA